MVEKAKAQASAHAKSANGAKPISQLMHLNFINNQQNKDGTNINIRVQLVTEPAPIVAESTSNNQALRNSALFTYTNPHK